MVSKLERIFPPSSSKQFAYVGAGSYAHVYRCKRHKEEEEETAGHGPQELSASSDTSATVRSPLSTCSMVPSPQVDSTISSSSIIKLIDVYSDNVLKSFNGTSSRSSVSTYKDAYNEFKVSLYLSYLNTGLDINKKYYKCCTFPDVYQIYVVNDSVPKYFESSCKIKQIDYGKLFPKHGEEEGESSASKQCRSRPSIRDLAATNPEIAM